MQEFPYKYITKRLATFAIGCLLVLPSLAQEIDSLAQVQSDSVSLALQNQVIIETEDTIKLSYPILSDVSIILDYGKLIAKTSDFESKMEVGVELGIKNNFLLNAEIGQSKLTPTNAYTNTNYKSEGSYYRVGVGYKRAMSAKTNMSLSVRYAAASFEDEGVIKIESTSGLYNEVEESFARKKLTANWYEIIFSSESELKPKLYLGFNFRVRIMSSYDKQVPIDVYSIPGYGRTFDKSVPVLNLYLKYKINFKK